MKALRGEEGFSQKVRGIAIQIIQKYYLDLCYSKINEQTSDALYKIYTLATFVTEINDAQVQIMVGTLVLDLESHLIVFKVAICMHKLKY